MQQQVVRKPNQIQQQIVRQHKVPTLIESFLPKNQQQFQYQAPPKLTPKNPALAAALHQTVDSRLDNFGTNQAMAQLSGTAQQNVDSVLQNPAHASLFNKDFSTILKKTQQKINHNNGY